MDLSVTLQGERIAHLLSEDLYITRELYFPSILGIFLEYPRENKLQEHLEKHWNKQIKKKKKRKYMF